jgi:2-aminoadipate transaminase
VVFLGSFSKVISPGMRVGYAIGPKPVVQKMVVCKQGEDVHTNIWSQIICNKLMTEYDFEAHLQNLKEIYKKKYAVLQKAMQEHLAPYITWDEVEGGLFVWCKLPDGVDMPDFCKQAVLRKVCVVPGNAFLTNENEPCQAFRINYSTPTDEQLVRGVEILGELIRDILRK